MKKFDYKGLAVGSIASMMIIFLPALSDKFGSFLERNWFESGNIAVQFLWIFLLTAPFFFLYVFLVPFARSSRNQVFISLTSFFIGTIIPFSIWYLIVIFAVYNFSGL